jgi:hypothetical protein
MMTLLKLATRNDIPTVFLHLFCAHIRNIQVLGEHSKVLNRGGRMNYCHKIGRTLLGK